MITFTHEIEVRESGKQHRLGATKSIGGVEVTAHGEWDDIESPVELLFEGQLFRYDMYARRLFRLTDVTAAYPLETIHV